MTNIVMLVKDRYRLTEQAVRTLYMNTPKDQFTLTLVNDGSAIETMHLTRTYSKLYENCTAIHFDHSIGIVGFLRNVGIAASERYFGRGDWVAFLDNDIAVFPCWLEKMTEALDMRDWVGYNVRVLGGCRHPFHGNNGTWGNVELTDAVAGYSMLMRWNTWESYGPFMCNQKGVGASEDFHLCQRIVADGLKVGYINPPVLAHTGLSNTDGNPATGHDSMERVRGIIYE